MKSSHRDLYNDVPEHKTILKNNENTYYPRFSCTPKTGIGLPKTGVLFLLYHVPRSPRLSRRRICQELDNFTVQLYNAPTVK